MIDGEAFMRGKTPRMLSQLAVLLVILGTGSCSCSLMGGPDDFIVEARPDEITVAPGQGFTPILRLSTCGGREGIRTPVTWTSSDTTIVTVHPTAGRVLAVRVGYAEVEATSERYGWLHRIQVSVQRPVTLPNKVLQQTPQTR